MKSLEIEIIVRVRDTEKGTTESRGRVVGLPAGRPSRAVVTYDGEYLAPLGRNRVMHDLVHACNTAVGRFVGSPRQNQKVTL